MVDIPIKKNGCHNREDFKPELWVRDGYVHTIRDDGRTVAIPNLRPINFTMSMECQHDKKETDPGCVGCRHVKKVEEA